MKTILSIIALSFTSLYVFCAFINWDLGILAHTTVGCRIGYVFASLFFSTVGIIAYEESK
jgi:hypothetical protein